MGRRHSLKAWPETFVPMWNGLMEYAVRKNDRDFQVGDSIQFEEFIPLFPAGHEDQQLSGAGGKTGRMMLAEVRFVTKGPDFGLPGDMCVMQLQITERKGP